jgi:polyhydroxybutyrate depolymerase
LSVEIDVNGTARTALLHVPGWLTKGESVPLVLVLHGTFLDGQGMADITGYSAVADARGFLVAYPDPTPDFPGWNAVESRDLPNDVDFLTKLIDHMEATYCVDREREFAVGFSAGGTMTHTAACRDRRISAIAMVSSGFAEGEAVCAPETGIPTLVIQGVLDPLIPWFGGRIPLPELEGAPPSRPVPDWTAQLAAQNGCDPDTDSLELAQIGDWVVPFEWQGCEAATILYRVGNGGHNWPGGTGLEVFGNVNKDINASETSYDFFLDNVDLPDSDAYVNEDAGYVVHVPPGWSEPTHGGNGVEGTVNDSVTFGLNFALTMIVLSTGSTADGVGTASGRVQGSTAQELAESLVALNPHLVPSSPLSVDGEPVVALRGTNYLAYVAAFTHAHRAYVHCLYSDIAGFIDTRAQVATFLNHLELMD